MKTTHVEPQSCPKCGKKLDAVSDAFGEASPGPGDMTVCLYCGQIMQFGEGGTLLLSSLSACHDEETRDRLHDVQRAVNVHRAWRRGQRN